MLFMGCHVPRLAKCTCNAFEMGSIPMRSTIFNPNLREYINWQIAWFGTKRLRIRVPVPVLKIRPHIRNGSGGNGIQTSVLPLMKSLDFLTMPRFGR